MNKHGIFIDKERTTKDVVWVTFYNYGEQIYSEPIAHAFRKYLEPAYQMDIDSGNTEKGHQPETALAKLRLYKAIEKDINKA